MAIILDNCNEVKTHYYDFIDRLEQKKDGLRCVLDIDLIFQEYSRTIVDDFKLIPLDKFTCKRTIVGTGGTNVNVDAPFGLTKGDFLYTGFQEVDLQEDHVLILKGLLITRTNPYYDIVNALAKYFEFVGAENNNSFVLDESELSEIKLVPFKLSYADSHFVVSDIEKEMATSEFDAIVEDLYCEDYAL